MKYISLYLKKISSFFNHPIVGMTTLAVSLIFPAVIYPMTVHAGLFSFLSSTIEGQNVSAKVNTVDAVVSSQKITLLQAVVNQNPNPTNSASNTVPVIDGQVLSPDLTGIDGTDINTPVNTQVSIYVVREGDTLSGIAKLFGVSVNTIVWANDSLNISRTSPLKTGQTLVILPVSGINYVVKKGDTIQKIVSKYKADLTEVLRYNDITVNSPLAIGDTVIIPDAELQVSIPTKMSFKINLNEPAYNTNGPDYPGYYIRPIKGGIKTQGLHGYNAVDLADRVGTPIYAAAAGTVIVSEYNSGWHGGYGNFIIISHSNGTQTVYAHLSKNIVHVGDYVAQGQNIALMGSTGNSTGPHVHFEIRGARNPF